MAGLVLHWVRRRPAHRAARQNARRNAARLAEDRRRAEQLSTPAPAGWYPDPDGAFLDRFWDGAVWTDSIRKPDPLAAR